MLYAFSLIFFADEQDAAVLLSWLNAEEDIAFIIQDRTHKEPSCRWKAVQNNTVLRRSKLGVGGDG